MENCLTAFQRQRGSKLKSALFLSSHLIPAENSFCDELEMWSNMLAFAFHTKLVSRQHQHIKSIEGATWSCTYDEGRSLIQSNFRNEILPLNSSCARLVQISFPSHARSRRIAVCECVLTSNRRRLPRPLSLCERRWRASPGALVDRRFQRSYALGCPGYSAYFQ